MIPALDRRGKVSSMHRGGVHALAGRRRQLWLSLLVLVAACLVYAAPAQAVQSWRINSLSDTTVAPGDTFEYLVQVTNVGDADMDGSEIDVTGALPSGLTAVDGRLLLDADPTEANFVSCTAGDGVSPLAGASDIRCVESTPVPSARNGNTWQLLRLTVRADVGAREGELLESRFAVAGGGASPAATVDPVRVTSAAPVFGVDAFDGQLTDAAGDPLTQAGGHPASAAVSFDLNTFTNPLPIGGAAWPVEPVKDVLVDLPPGLVGDPTVVDQCTLGQLASSRALTNRTLCPPTAQVGTISLRMNNRPLIPPVLGTLAVYNMVPPPDAPARFGFVVSGTVVVFDARCALGATMAFGQRAERLGGASGRGTTFTFWGVPADPHTTPSARVRTETRRPSVVPRARAARRARRSCVTRRRAARRGLPTTIQSIHGSNPGVFQSTTFTTHLPPAYPAPPSGWGAGAGPDRLRPGAVRPEIRRAARTGAKPGSPSAASRSISRSRRRTIRPGRPVRPQESGRDAPAGRARVAVVRAMGLQACSPAQIALHERTRRLSGCGEARDGHDHDAAAARSADGSDLSRDAARQPVRDAAVAVPRRERDPGWSSSSRAGRGEPGDRAR